MYLSQVELNLLSSVAEVTNVVVQEEIQDWISIRRNLIEESQLLEAYIDELRLTLIAHKIPVPLGPT